MPKEVRAEEIERFLGTVDGVASARLLISPSGEIDQIYVTADAATEGRAARRAVVAALITHFGIPVEPWRVQVAQVKRFSPAEIAHLRTLRLEETVSETEVAARVQVAWERAGEQRTGIGQARGPFGAEHRLRTLAAATVDAARAVVEPAHRRITVQHVSLVTCMDRPLVLVGIVAAAARGHEAFVGSAFSHQSPSDAAVAAALDAVTKYLLRAAFEEPEASGAVDRRARLEAMRRFARAGGRAGAEPLPAAAAAPGAGDRLDAPRGAAPSGSPHPAWPASAPPAAASSLEDGGQRAKSGEPGIPSGSDILEDIREIRPEGKGGAVMAAHHEGPRGGAAPPRPGRPAVEDEFLGALIDRRTPVHVRCRDGYEVPHGILREIGTYTVLVEADGMAELLYKHAIISIRPVGPRA